MNNSILIEGVLIFDKEQAQLCTNTMLNVLYNDLLNILLKP